MEVIWNPNDFIAVEKTVLTLGIFDGVHLGHQALIRQIIERAKATHRQSMVITFEPHPQLVLEKNSAEPLRILTTIEEKIARLNTTDLDWLIVVPFSPSFAEMKPEDFVEQILLKQLNMAEIFIGRDHTFGRRRTGNIELLKRMGAEKDFRVSEVHPIFSDDAIVSSTRIRSLLKDRQIEKATALLGRPYSLQGRVIHGEGRGKSLGFPTVNLRPFSVYKLVPQTGLYLSRFYYQNRSFAALTYIGKRPTFGLEEIVIETFVLDFDQEIYGMEITVELLKFIREDMTFATTQQLKKQIEQDVRKSLELFATLAS